jgi:hypothetical protein
MRDGMNPAPAAGESDILLPDRQRFLQQLAGAAACVAAPAYRQSSDFSGRFPASYGCTNPPAEASHMMSTCR